MNEFSRAEVMVEIMRNHLGYHSRQHDYVLLAEKDGETVGRLSYSVFEGTPSVKGIDVSVKRQRIGTQLVLALQEHHPETPIDFGGLTDEGSLLLGSLEWAVVENRDYTEAAEELAKLKAKLEYLVIKADSVICADRETRDAFMKECECWNETQDRADELGERLRHMKPSFRFVVGGKAGNEAAPTPSP